MMLLLSTIEKVDELKTAAGYTAGVEQPAGIEAQIQEVSGRDVDGLTRQHQVAIAQLQKAEVLRKADTAKLSKLLQSTAGQVEELERSKASTEHVKDAVTEIKYVMEMMEEARAVLIMEHVASRDQLEEVKAGVEQKANIAQLDEVRAVLDHTVAALSELHALTRGECGDAPPRRLSAVTLPPS